MIKTYTHKGWFFFCPVYMNANQPDGMDVSARHRWLDWWFDVNEVVFDFLGSFSAYTPPFPFRVTGKGSFTVTLNT